MKIFIHAPMEARIKRIRDEYGEKADDYKNYVTRMDKKRVTYYTYFTQFKWGRANDYDLSLNSKVGVQTCAEIIQNYVNKLSTK